MASFNLNNFWASETAEHTDVATKTFAALQPDFEKMLNACAVSIKNGGKILFFGNGGSAADAQHLATELAVRYINNRKPITALALTTDTSALTAIGNDYGFDHLFARQIEALGKPGDIAIGISTSGKSPNIIKALETARTLKLTTVGLTGESGGTMPAHCDILLKIPSRTTARIQEMHITLGQMLCGALELKLGLI
jgi:D-sedoheptulose 7-phosphate isomerase